MSDLRKVCGICYGRASCASRTVRDEIIMGRARRFNNYTDDVRKARNIVKEYGQIRQGKVGIGSSFRTSPFGVITGNSGAKTDADKLSLITGGEMGGPIGWTDTTHAIHISYLFSYKIPVLKIERLYNMDVLGVIFYSKAFQGEKCSLSLGLCWYDIYNLKVSVVCV